MTGMPEQLAPALDQVEIEGAGENDKKEPREPGEKNKEEDAAPQTSKNNIADKDEDEDKAEKYTTKEEENDKNKEKDKVKGDDDEKTEEGNKDDEAEKKRKKIFKTYTCNVCKNVIKRRTQASISCKACMEWCHVMNCSGLKNTKEAQIMKRSYRCQICVKKGREIATDPPRRGRPRESTTSKLQHVSNLQRSESKKRKSFDKEETPVKRSPQGKRNNNVEDKTEDKIPKDKPTGQTKENNKTEEEKMETEPSDNNNKVLLKYDGINITKEDKDTLKQGEFLSDNIISFAFALYESKNEEKMCNNGNVLVRPEMAHLLKNVDRPRARQQMKALGIDKAKRVIIPLNNSEQLDECSSGSHWTILDWDRESNTFFHIDSLPGQNAKHAKNLASDLLDGSLFDNTGNLQASFIELEEYGKQKNGYNCGLYVIYNAMAMIKILIDTESFDNLRPDPEEINQLRKSIVTQIENEIKLKENTCGDKQNNVKNYKPEDTVNNQKS